MKKSKRKQTSIHQIGTLAEKSLHSALKEWYSCQGDQVESNVEGYHIDIIQSDLLIEIQTANFASLRTKLTRLTKKHHVRLVYPIAQEKWIARLATDSKTKICRRKSPKRGYIYQLFQELVSIPNLIRNSNFSLEVLMIQEEEVRCQDGKGSWRRKGLSISDRCLIQVLSRNVFKEPFDFLALIPRGLKEPYSTQDLAESIEQPRWLAQKMAYCLRSMGAIEIVGKNGNSFLYSTSIVVRA